MSENKKPCPCGSGKTYENCCGIREALYFQEQARWRSAGQELRRTLGRFADRPHFSWDAARAQDLYLGCIDQKLIDSDDDFIMERCLEWFIFDYRLNSGRTIIETYRDEYHQSLSGPEAALLQSWAYSCSSLYEVTEVLPKKGLIIKDIFNSVEIKISDVNASLNIEQGSVLLMRVLQVGEEYEFSTSGLALPRRLRDPLQQKLQRDRLQFYREQKTRVKGWGDYLKERAHVINGWIMDLGMSNPVSGIDMPEKDTLERIAILTIVNWEQVLGFIKNSAQFRLIGETNDAAGAFQQAAAAILGESCCSRARREAEAGPGGAGRAPDYGRATLRPVIGRLILSTRFIIVNAATVELLADCKDLLLRLFNKIILNAAEHGHKNSCDNPRAR